MVHVMSGFWTLLNWMMSWRFLDVTHHPSVPKSYGFRFPKMGPLSVGLWMESPKFLVNIRAHIHISLHYILTTAFCYCSRKKSCTSWDKWNCNKNVRCSFSICAGFLPTTVPSPLLRDCLLTSILWYCWNLLGLKVSFNKYSVSLNGCF